MKRVSYKVALAIKEAGYPQRNTEIGTSLWYTENGEFTDGCLKDRYVVCPTYIDVWFWLWREKHIALEVYVTSYDKWAAPIDVLLWYKEYSDPEEAIEQAIEYMVDNDLIK